MAVIPLDELTNAVTRLRRAHHHLNTYTADQISAAYTTIHTIRHAATGQLRRWLDTFTLTALTARTTGELDAALTTLAEHLRITTPPDPDDTRQLSFDLDEPLAASPPLAHKVDAQH